MARLPVLLLLLLALVGAGCAGDSSDSGTDFSGVQGEVAAVVEDLETAAAAGDEEEVCGDLLTKELAAQVKAGPRTCSTLLGDALDDTDVFDLEVTKVTVSGATAKADVIAGSGEGEKRSSLTLQKVGPGWRISALQ